MTRHLMLAALSMVAREAVAQQQLRCSYSKAVICLDGKCQPLPINTEYLLIPHPDSLVEIARRSSPTESPPLEVRRCHDRGCTPIPVRASVGGLYVSATGNAYALTITAFDSRESTTKKGTFVESLVGFPSLTYWGTCPIE